MTSSEVLRLLRDDLLAVDDDSATEQADGDASRHLHVEQRLRVLGDGAAQDRHLRVVQQQAGLPVGFLRKLLAFHQRDEHRDVEQVLQLGEDRHPFGQLREFLGEAFREDLRAQPRERSVGAFAEGVGLFLLRHQLAALAGELKGESVAAGLE